VLPVAILAGGLATRLRPLTSTLPKSLIDVNGEPFIVHQLRLLRDHQIDRVVLCVGYLGELIRAAVGDGRAYGVRIEYAFDGPAPLGTAGAIRSALSLLGSAFFVLYGDSYLPCDYGAVEVSFLASGKAALMTVIRNDGLWDTSNVEFKDGRVIAYDKKNRTPRMRWIDYGLGVFQSSAFAQLPEDEAYDLAKLYQDLLRKGELAAFETRERFYEIGSLEGLKATADFLARRGARGFTMTASTFAQQYLREAATTIEQLDPDVIEKAARILAETRGRGGRLFILGVGGSAANASHAVNDFRKIAGIEAYTPTDNVSELTARTNDDGWASVFESWLRVSRLNARDLILVFSVGGGNIEKNVSPNLVAALQLAKSVGAGIIGVVGRDGGYTAQVADACVIVPTVNPAHVTPHAEAFQGLIWHLLVSHPAVKQAETKWESVK
jgi:D-sedoheptulose 7-phosphate isomerase